MGSEPAYKVWEIVHRRRFRLDRIIGIGGAAELIVPLLAEKMGCHAWCTASRRRRMPSARQVARPTLAVSLYADTQQKRLLIDQEGIEERIADPDAFQLDDAREKAVEHLARLAAAKGMVACLHGVRVQMAEQFNMIRGYSRVGKIFQVEAQIVPGLIDEFKGVAE